MNDPVKLIYKYKNINKRSQYQLFIYVGYLLDDSIKKILLKIKKLNFYDTLIELSMKEIDQLSNVYGIKWYTYFFLVDHLELSFNLIQKSSLKRKEIDNKFGKDWIDKNIRSGTFFDNRMYSYPFLFKRERELRERNKNLREKHQTETEDYNTKRFQGGGENIEYDIGNVEEDSYNKENIKEDNDDLQVRDDDNAYILNDNLQAGGDDDDGDDDGDNGDKGGEDDGEAISMDQKLEFDDIDEFDLEELENMYQEVDIDENVKTTSKLIDQAMKSDEKNITSKKILLDFPDNKNDIMYDDSLKNVFFKHYVFEQYIFKDDTIKKLKEKVCCSIKLNSIFETSGDTKHKAYLTPSRLYMWSKYQFTDQIDNKSKSDSIMLGQKWIKRSEMLKIEIEPNDNIRIYEELKGNLKNLKQDMRKYGSRIRREEDEFKLLEDYDKYIQNNEIYVIDIFNELGMNYLAHPDKLKNLYEIYIKIYFFHITSDDFKQIINYLNIKDEQNRKYEITQMKNIFQTMNNDLILENEIIKTVELVDFNKNEIQGMFQDNYITHSVIHSYVAHTNTFNSPILDLFRIFDNFIMTKDYPFLQYQLLDGKMIYKFDTKVNENDKSAIMAKWFENSPYGISFKIRAEQKGGSTNKYIALSLNENGRLEYKIQWKEDDKATVDDIKKTYVYIKNLVIKINSENTKLKIEMPKDEDFVFAFINSIQKFEFDGKKSINHNDLSDFSRFFYPYISLVIEPRKRGSKQAIVNPKSKYGTYLRYKRVSKYENESKIEHRIVYFMKNYEYTDISLVKEIAKQFNITNTEANNKIENVKKKYPIIKKSRKILKRLESAPKYNNPGIGIDIQGKSRLNYKIRISGARNKDQLSRIIKFMNVMIYLYIQTYLEKNKDMQKLKDKLKDLVNIAKRRNKVDNIIDLEDIEVKTVKQLTKFDSDRLGYKPEEGESHWTRSCQNSGTKRRQPQQYVYSSIDELLVKGYKYNDQTKAYEKSIKIGKKMVTLKAAELMNLKDKGNKFYYVCDPAENKEYTYVGFLSRSKNPSDLCMPCCFKKNPLESNNRDKKNYYLKCMGKIKDIEYSKKKIQTDKIYILQDTNKIQEGRFGMLPDILDNFLNKIDKNKINIKNHYLVNTIPYYFFKYGVKSSLHPFIEALSNIYDIDADNIKKKLIDILEKDNKDILFTSLDSGNIKTQFKSRDLYIEFIKNNNYLEYDVLGDFISKPGVLSNNGINFFIFEKKSVVIKKTLEKKKIIDDYNLLCTNYDDNLYKYDETRDNIILLKDNKIFYPIFVINKQNLDEEVTINRIFKKDKNIDKCVEFYKLGCNRESTSKFNKGIQYSCKIINNQLLKLNKEYHIKQQVVDLRNKCRYIILNNDIVLPIFPSGTIYNIPIKNKVLDNIKSIKITINNLLDIDSKIDTDMKPIGFLYTDKKDNTYKIVAFLLNNDIELRITPEVIHENEIIKIAKLFNKKEFKKKNISEEDIIDQYIKNKENMVDDRIENIKLKAYDKESYELFRLELSNYLSLNDKIKDKILKILINNKITIHDKKVLLKKVLFKNIDTELYNLVQTGGNSTQFIEIGDKDINYNKYKIKNKRDLCNTHISKDMCAGSNHCKWKTNTCKMIIPKDKAIIYVNKIIQELVKDEMKSKEILSIDNYYVSDIVDFDNFTQRDDEEIIKSDIPNINKILSQIFGEDNIPIIGKRKFYKIGKTIEEENNENQLEILGDFSAQNIILNNNTILRAFTNCYYWISNNLYQTEFRNLGYWDVLQTDLSNYFRGNIIDFLTDNSNDEYIDMNIKQYLNISIDNYIQDLSTKDNLIYNGIIELLILSKLYEISIMVVNNYDEIIYILDKGSVIEDKKIEKIKNISKYKDIKFTKKSIVIMLEFNFGSNKPSKIKSIYY